MRYPKKLSIHVQTSMSRGGISFLSLQDENGHTRGDMGPNEQPYIAIADQIVKAYNLFPAMTQQLLNHVEEEEKNMKNFHKKYPEAVESIAAGKTALKRLEEPIPYE